MTHLTDDARAILAELQRDAAPSRADHLRDCRARIIRATRRSARAALDRQLVGGFAVDLPRGRIVFHSAPGLWVLAARGADDEYFHSIDAVLDAVFGGVK